MTYQLTCIVAEDVTYQRELYSKYATECGLKVISSTAYGSRLVELCLKLKPDILFLDIGLERTDGITACKELLKKGFRAQIVIVSESTDPKHILTCMNELNASTYLTKPFFLEQFQRAVDKAALNINSLYLLHQVQGESLHLIRVQTMYKVQTLNENTILYKKKAKHRSVYIYLINGEMVTSSTPIKKILEQSSGSLFIPHRGYLANIQHIIKISADEWIEGNYEITLRQTHEKIPLTRRNYSHFIQAKQEIRLET